MARLRGALPKSPSEKPPSPDPSQDSSGEPGSRTCPVTFGSTRRTARRRTSTFVRCSRRAARGFSPDYVVFDSWYSGLDNLKTSQRPGLALLHAVEEESEGQPGRHLQPADQKIRIPEEAAHGAPEGLRLREGLPDRLHRRRRGRWRSRTTKMRTRARRKPFSTGQRTTWTMTEEQAGGTCPPGLGRGDLPPTTQAVLWSRAVAMHQSAQAQHNHIQMSIRAFLRLELHRVETALSFYESKTAIIRDAIRAYLADPIHVLPSSA